MVENTITNILTNVFNYLCMTESVLVYFVIAVLSVCCGVFITFWIVRKDHRCFMGIRRHAGCHGTCRLVNLVGKVPAIVREAWVRFPAGPTLRVLK